MKRIEERSSDVISTKIRKSKSYAKKAYIKRNQTLLDFCSASEEWTTNTQSKICCRTLSG